MNAPDYGTSLNAMRLTAKRIFILWLVLSAVSGLAQEEVFPAAFQRIAKMKPAEAEQAYAQLAEKTAKPVQQDAAWLAAVEKALEGKRSAEADIYLRRIKDEQTRSFATLKVLQGARKWNGIIAFSKDFKLESWRENLIPEAALIRAQAYAISKKPVEAEKDIALAMESVNTPEQKGEMLFALGNLYAQYLKDPAKELELMRPVMAGLNGCSHHFQQRLFCRYAELLAGQGQVAEAIKSLESYQVDRSPSRRYQVKSMLAKLYLCRETRQKRKRFRSRRNRN